MREQIQAIREYIFNAQSSLGRTSSLEALTRLETYIEDLEGDLNRLSKTIIELKLEASALKMANDIDLEVILGAWRDKVRELEEICDLKTANYADLEMERDEYAVALDKIASWPEGEGVTGSFDEPGSAQTARDARKDYR
jgi:hypothetical protein